MSRELAEFATSHTFYKLSLVYTRLVPSLLKKTAENEEKW